MRSHAKLNCAAKISNKLFLFYVRKRHHLFFSSITFQNFIVWLWIKNSFQILLSKVFTVCLTSNEAMCIKYNKLNEIQSHLTSFEGPTLVNILTLSHLFLTYLNRYFSFLILVLFYCQEIIPALIKFKQ